MPEFPTETTLMMAETHMHARKVFEDAILDRNVCERKVLIEKHLPKYMGSPEVEYKPDRDFFVTMGLVIMLGESIYNLSKTMNDTTSVVKSFFKNPFRRNKNKKKDVKNSMWEIGKFTFKNLVFGSSSKWEG